MRLHDFLDYWNEQQPEAEFASLGQRRWTYREARDTANRLANALLGAGLVAGDRVAVLAKNSPEYLLLYFAAAKAGCVLVPLNYRLTPTDWASILGDANARVLFAADPFRTALEAERDRLASVEHFVALDEAGPRWESFAAWLSSGSPAPPQRVVSDEQDLYQMYTSGTTGPPKGAVLTHRSVTANMVQNSVAIGAQPGERALVVAPMFHAAVVPAALGWLVGGGSLLVQADFVPAEVVRAFGEERVVYALLVAAMIHACLVDVPDVATRSYPSLRLIQYGASPIAETTLRQALTAFRCEFLQSYGLTEATQALTFLSPADHRRAVAERPGLLLSAGRPALGTEIRVVDDGDEPVAPGVVGEIVARGPQLMRGYWNRPRETADTLRGGWLHTGDAGYVDANGYVYVQDRLKDVIVSGGENVYPRAVEEVLYQHPAIVDVAVIGVPDERWGETVKAVVVLRAAQAVTEAEIVDFCRGKVAGFARPRSVDFVEALPRNPSGKVLKRVLREPYWRNQPRRVAGA
jgi:acyl-CoA synthetase (AMP-forming)/AMP-acid ligase II